MTLLSSTTAGAPVRAPLRRACRGVLLAAALTACTTATAEPPTVAQSGPPAAADSMVPSVEPGPTRAPAPRLEPIPAAGKVQVQDGPFTDRLGLTELTLDPSAPAVTGVVRDLVDVSELIVLELEADFYDSDGRYLGSGTATYADEEFADIGATAVPHGTGEHEESFDVVIRAAAPLVGVASAVLTVPALVNE